MALIQHITLGFCSVFIFLMGGALGTTICQASLQNLFKNMYTQSVQMSRSVTPLFSLRYFFSPDDQFVAMINKNEGIMANPVEIVQEGSLSSVKFTVMHNGYNSTPKMVCETLWCSSYIQRLQKSLDPITDDLACFKPINQPLPPLEPIPSLAPRFSADDDYGIRVVLPWISAEKFQSFVILKGDWVLTSLLEAGLTQDRLPLTSGYVRMIGDRVSFVKTGGGQEDIYLPQDLHPRRRQQIKAALALFNRAKKDHTFPKKPA